MRTILFRGKRADNGEWVEGGIYHNSEDEIVFIIKDTGLGYHEFIEVIPETVGQFTGLYDKTGTKKIFEGDIIRRFLDYLDEFTGDTEKVIYGIHNCSCCHSVYGWSTETQDEMLGNNLGWAKDCIIIGNIHDNPELLEGETE